MDEDKAYPVPMEDQDFWETPVSGKQFRQQGGIGDPAIMGK